MIHYESKNCWEWEEDAVEKNFMIGRIEPWSQENRVDSWETSVNKTT